MTKLIEDLEAAGWVDTTMGECRPGEEVVIVDNGHVRHEFITRADVTRGTVSDAKGFQWAAETPAQRPPRPEYAPGTVALIRVRGSKSLVRAWRMRGYWIPSGGMSLDDDIEVVRVLLPADQDTPPIEVTDEMVGAAFVSLTGDGTVRWADGTRDPRGVVREALKAALGVEK